MNLYFDMDGTLVDYYAQKDWLEDLKKEQITAFLLAKPLYNVWDFSCLLCELQRKGHKINIISWLPKNASNKYAERVKQAKLHWLKENLLVYPDEIQIVPYGTNKKEITGAQNGILFDDEEQNRKDWGANAFSPAVMEEILRQMAHQNH